MYSVGEADGNLEVCVRMVIRGSSATASGSLTVEDISTNDLGTV